MGPNPQPHSCPESLLLNWEIQPGSSPELQAPVLVKFSDPSILRISGGGDSLFKDKPFSCGGTQLPGVPGKKPASSMLPFLGPPKSDLAFQTGNDAGGRSLASVFFLSGGPSITHSLRSALPRVGRRVSSAGVWLCLHSSPAYTRRLGTYKRKYAVPRGILPVTRGNGGSQER